MATFVMVSHPVTILITEFNNQDNSTNDLGFIYYFDSKKLITEKMMK